MRHSFAIRILIVICMSAVCVKGTWACQCGATSHGRSPWENAKLVTENAAFVFEGTPVKFELKWKLLSAKDGDLIPADMFSGKDLRDPQMAITFRISKQYKGNLGSEVQLYTGLGGGDCGAIYAPGMNYLLYAYGTDPHDLGVSMCSPGGWIESSQVATYLRYLRNQRPTPEDMAPNVRWTATETPEQKQQRQREYEEGRRRYAVATGRICGKMVGLKQPGGSIAFLSTQGYSPAGYPDATINEDGSFCSRDLGPGKYYLFFVRRSDDGALAFYYPGVTEIAKATAIDVTAGQTVSNVEFKAGTQHTYSVRGFVSADDKPKSGSNAVDDVTVLLIRTDGDRRVWYSEKARFILPKLAYFKVEDVVPGHYAACVLGPGAGWMTRRADVNVTSHMKVISLDLVRKK